MKTQVKSGKFSAYVHGVCHHCKKPVLRKEAVRVPLNGRTSTWCSHSCLMEHARQRENLLQTEEFTTPQISQNQRFRPLPPRSNAFSTC